MKAKIILPLVLIATLLVAGLYYFNPTNSASSSAALESILEKSEQLNIDRPEDRIYAQLDKPLYAPGETIWFSAHVRNGVDLKPSTTTDIVRAELWNPNGSIAKQYKLILENGIAKGDFQLDKDAVGGQYQLKVYSQWQQNDPNPAIFTKNITVQKTVLPRLKMALDFVNEAYGPGDLVEAELKLESNNNEVLKNKAFDYLVSIGGSKAEKISGKTKGDGTAIIRFKIPASIGTTDALLNVLIPHNGKNESIARRIPVLLNDIKVNFFPEGGDLVNGLESKVGFKAINTFGEEVDIQGYVRDSKGEIIASAESFHQGMGAFDLKPKTGEQYFLDVTYPTGIFKKFELPQILQEGYVLSLNKVKENAIHLNVLSSQKDEVSLIASVRGKSLYSTTLKVAQGSNKLVIPTKDFPSGVTQITLFDKNGFARAERMTFVNLHKQLKIDIKPNKEKYLPREKVQIDLDVKDQTGSPTAAVLSLSVVDDQLLSYADDRSSNILSWMLLEADIDAQVKEPAFYFDPNEEKATQALDYVLMTSGWRRFKWEQIATNDLPKLAYQAEKKIIAGTVLNKDGKVLSGAKVVIKDYTKPIKTNASGEFIITDDILLVDNPVEMNISAPGHWPQRINLGEYGDMDYQLQDRAEVFDPNFLQQNNDIAVTSRPTENVSVMNSMTFQVKSANKAYKKGNRPATTEEIENDVNGKVIVEDYRTSSFVVTIENTDDTPSTIRPNIAYYRAREFATPQYSKNEKLTKRTDFRSTVFWDGLVEVDENGKASLSFYNSDAITSFKVSTEGFGSNGEIGRAEQKYFTEMPFSLEAKIPIEVVVGDQISVPVTLFNNTNSSLNGQLDITVPNSFKKQGKHRTTVSLEAKESKTLWFDYQVKEDVNIGEQGDFSIAFKSKAFEDELKELVSVVPKGFPVHVAHSGTDKESTYEIDITKPIDNSVEVFVEAYPNILSEVMEGLEAMIRKPGGCFEQTSSSNYPNVLALQYLMETKQDNLAIRRKANKYMKTGYDRLKTFESPSGGFDWFPNGTGNESLTAYALLQFTHMKQVYNGVETALLDRTTDWILSRRDGRGGFNTNKKTSYSLGNINDTQLNAFIVFALSEAKVNGIEKELQLAYKKALSSKDDYQKTLVANALLNYNEQAKAQEVLASLTGDVIQNARTTFGGGKLAYGIQTNALNLLAMLQQDQPDRIEAQRLASAIRQQKKGYGGFGSTFSTVLALKALTKHSKYTKKTAEDGTIEVYVDHQKVATQTYKKGESAPIKISGLAQYLQSGKHTVSIKYPDVQYPLPHTLSVNWQTDQPESSSNCVLALDTRMDETKVKVGETVRLAATLSNTTDKVQATPMAIIGLPAGLSPQAWQLKEMMDKEEIAYYEIVGNNLIFYYRQITPKEQKKIKLDLKADFAGNFEAPASSAYSYYADEHKQWSSLGQITVTN